MNQSIKQATIQSANNISQSCLRCSMQSSMYMHANGLQVYLECTVVQQTATESIVSQATPQARGLMQERPCSTHSAGQVAQEALCKGAIQIMQQGVQVGRSRGWGRLGDCATGSLQAASCRRGHAVRDMRDGSCCEGSCSRGDTKWTVGEGSQCRGHAGVVRLEGLCWTGHARGVLQEGPPWRDHAGGVMQKGSYCTGCAEGVMQEGSC